jgi:Fe-S-cluster containining protein
MCCRGPIILRLTRVEVRGFKERAVKLGVDLQITQTADGGEWVRFSKHLGENCPMLDAATFVCRIYEDRPQRCREFPQKPTPGCALSGYTEEDAG